MSEAILPKDICDSIGRNFNLWFTRSIMYHLEHPATKEALKDFFGSITDGLKVLSPIVFIMHHDQFYVEEEPLDPRINASRLIGHFKRIGVTSVSFEEGIIDAELGRFMQFFSNSDDYSTDEALKDALSKAGITHLRVNHVYFRKISEDDEIISGGKTTGAGAGSPGDSPDLSSKKIEKLMAESLALDELEKALSLKGLVDDPEKFSQALIETDVSSYQEVPAENARVGSVLSEQLRKLGKEVSALDNVGTEVDLVKLAEAVLDMRRNLIEGIEVQKAAGVIFFDENKIREEADVLSDQVIARLVKEEYCEGEISIPRLVQIVRRLIPDPAELKRLLPALREILMHEGMSAEDWLEFVRSMGKELESERLAHVLEESAEDIGLSRDDLIDEIKRDPKAAAELIYLASEIKKGTGDENVLKSLLIDYVERIGVHKAIETADEDGEAGIKHIQNVVSQVESELVGKLRKRGMRDSLITSVESVLQERLNDVMLNTKTDLIARRFSLPNNETVGTDSIVTVLEATTEGPDEIKRVLQCLLERKNFNGLDRDKLQQIYEDLTTPKPAEPNPIEKRPLPAGIFNRKTILYFLKKELSRANRYGLPFAAIMLSVVKVSSSNPIPADSINQEVVFNALLEKLATLVRETDLVGAIDENKIIALLPMTDEKGSNLAVRRILDDFDQNNLNVGNIPLSVKFAAVSTIFHPDLTPTLKEFLRLSESGINQLVRPQKQWLVLEDPGKRNLRPAKAMKQL